MEKVSKPVYWTGKIPTQDDWGWPIVTLFIDGRTKQGPWAILSAFAFDRYGVGLGVGKGQMYQKQEDGRWLKVDG